MKNKWKGISLIFIVAFSALVLVSLLFFWGEDWGYETLGQKISFWVQGMLLVSALLLTPTLITTSRRMWAKDKARTEWLNPKEDSPLEPESPFVELTHLATYCQQRYGPFWTYRLKKVWVTGDAKDVERVVPTLTTQKWVIADNVILLWSDALAVPLSAAWIANVKRHCGQWGWLKRRPIDSAIWVLPEPYKEGTEHGNVTLEQQVLNLQQRNKALGWDIPLYVIEPYTLPHVETDRPTQAVGIALSGHRHQKVSAITEALKVLPERCLALGMHQTVRHSRHVFLLSFSQYLENQHLPRLTSWFTQWFALKQRPVLRGLYFYSMSPLSDTAVSESDLPRAFYSPNATVRAVLKDAKKSKVKRLGVDWVEFGSIISLCFLGLCVLGLLRAYVTHRTLIQESRALVTQLTAETQLTYPERLRAQQALRLQIGNVSHRMHSRSPLYLTVGLPQQGRLLACLWQYYYQANQKNVALPFLHWLHSNLTYFPKYHAHELGNEAVFNHLYDMLKSYMMLGNKEKIEGAFLSDFVAKHWPPPRTIDVAEWQQLMPQLIEYWAEILPSQPRFMASLDAALIAETRKTLIGQIGVQNAEETIYEDILTKAKAKFGDHTLDNLLAGIDYSLLFSSDALLPGIYTREAWEEFIKRKFTTAAKSRKEHVDWVLADGNEKIMATGTPKQLTQRLTQRYFDDYGKAWQTFLNTVQWQHADTIPEAISQLTLLSDPHKSPLLALLSLVKYQAEVEYRGDGLPQEILHKAQRFIKRPRMIGNAFVETEKNVPSGPLTPKFKPIVDLLSPNKDELTLQTYLLRVAQVRVKLQNVISSVDPQLAAETLVRTIFKGKSMDLVESRDYGNLIVTQLGGEWAGMAYTFFKQPLEQAWQVILDPAAKSFNENWQQQVVYEWEKSFAGRYPFKLSDNDASLVELSRFMRPDAGLIDRFIHIHLAGVLIKQGDRWLPDPVNAEGLHFTPEFLSTLNMINQITSQIFASGDAKVEFDLMPRSGHAIVKSELIIDKQKVMYFNQMPMWHRIRWPGDAYSPFAQLSWSSDGTGLKLYEHDGGNWGWIRLLEHATIRQLDSSRYELVWDVSSGRQLKYILRTQSGSGPLSLLKLKGFRLPKQVFDINGHAVVTSTLSSSPSE